MSWSQHEAEPAGEQFASDTDRAELGAELKK